MFDLLKKSSFFILIGIFLIFIFLFTKDPNPPEQSDLSSTVISTGSSDSTENTFPDIDSTSSVETIMVDIKGAIRKPGVYEMKTDDRVHDVIEKAGGFLEDADQTAVNLAQKVHDEMIIIVPNKIDMETSTNPSFNGMNSRDGKIRINYASQEELETLPGIGPSKAQAIIQYREEHGYFQSVEDLLQVSGIGEKTLENFKDEIQIP